MYHSETPGFDQIVMLLVTHVETIPTSVCDRCLIGALAMTLTQRAVQRGSINEADLDKMIEGLITFRDEAESKRAEHSLLNAPTGPMN